MDNSKMTLEQLEKRRSLQRTEEYRAKKRIRDKRYRESEDYKRKHPNTRVRVKLSKEETKRREKEQKKKQKKAKQNKNTEWLIKYKKDKCCSACGYNEHTEILQFHHLRDKEGNISQFKKKSLERIKLEVDKCVLLCPNCHFLLHSQERGQI